MKAAPPSNDWRPLGTDRVLAPAAALPQPADRLDATGPCRPHEFELAVDRLCLDSTSFRNLRERGAGAPSRMAAHIADVVRARGKMHNPETDSGGIAVGTVTAVGERCRAAPERGERIVTLASLTLTPLRLDEVVRVDANDPQVEVRGAAYLPDGVAWGPVPDDLPLAAAVAIYDVYAAASLTRELAPETGTVCVLGGGHAGKLAMAAARDAMTAGTVVVADIDPEAARAALDLGLCDVAATCDLSDPLGSRELLNAAGAPAADLTVVVVNATGCEPSAILATKPAGTILFFSMATSFSTAALTADGMASPVRMVIGNGFTEDRGAYALDLARRSEPLRAALGLLG
ncbi:MAG TPA: hypothetical protein VFM57_09820 [Thermoleophilaceae bacterium]|nr:hypothetical protein [Thermoleophilaceae bacterium]